jgi:CRISPR/Cas system-associated exonuclease Cas4 (RecB family)
MEKLSTFAMEHRPWSISKLNVAQQCPYKFHLQYIVKAHLGPDAIVIEEPIHLRIGKAVHEILAHALLGISVDTAIKGTSSKYRLTTTERDYLNGYIPAIKHFLERYVVYKGKHKIQQELVETKINITLDGKTCTWYDNTSFFRAVVDLVSIYPNNTTALVMDHKTGKPKEINTHIKQLEACALATRTLHPNIRQCVLAVHNIQESNLAFKDKGKPDNTPYEVLFDNVIKNVNESTKLTSTKKRNRSPLCAYCDYEKICQK